MQNLPCSRILDKGDFKIVRAYKAESELVNGVMRDVGVCSAAVAMIVGKILRVNRVLWQAEKRVFVWLAGGSDPYGCC